MINFFSEESIRIFLNSLKNIKSNDSINYCTNSIIKSHFPLTLLGNDAKIVAGMLTGTYTGGSVNFNAVALEYGFQKKGILYAGTIAVDNVVTALWILVTLILPMLLSRIWKSKIGVNKINSDKLRFSDKGINITSLAWLTFLGITSFYLSEILVEYFPRIPSILILTTIGIGLAQTKFVANLKGSHDLGLYLVYLFLAVIGAYCEFNAVYQLKTVSVNTNPFTEELDKALENLPDDVRDELYDQIFKSTVSGSMETAVDDMAANIVKAAAAVALGGALAKSEFVEPKADAKKEESIERHNEMIYEYVEYLEETMNEGPALCGRCDEAAMVSSPSSTRQGVIVTLGITSISLIRTSSS